MGNYLKKEVIKLTGRLLAKETRAIRIIYCIIDIIIQCKTSALLFWQKCFKAAYILVLEHIADYSAKDFTA
ncbi:MAG: hypothetical protein QOK66_05590 [Nitrososphaeraceae archaeon]|nr:hypothetical protein [Nitrososphaeraceae archaeon]